MKQFLLTVLMTFNGFVLCAQETPCTQTISGEVRDKISTDVLVGAEVVLSDENGIALQTLTIKEDGFFSFKIACETKYILEGKKEEFTAESKAFTTTNQENRVLQLIILLDKGNIDFVNDGAANAKAIDSVAKAEIEVPTITPDIIVKEIKEPGIERQMVKEETPSKRPPKKIVTTSKDNLNLPVIDPIYFDYESSWLNQKAKNGLQQLINRMKKYPKMVIECAAYADAKGEIEYNQWMSDRRAKRAIDFIISKGISATRISGKGYGETNLINDCTNEKECTNEQRAINRRTEFVIVKM